MNQVIANLCCTLTIALLLQCAAADSGTPRAPAGTPSRGTLIRFFGVRGLKAQQAVANKRRSAGVADFLKRFEVCELIVAAVQVQWDVTEWGIGMVTR